MRLRHPAERRFDPDTLERVDPVPDVALIRPHGSASDDVHEEDAPLAWLVLERYDGATTHLTPLTREDVVLGRPGATAESIALVGLTPFEMLHLPRTFGRLRRVDEKRWRYIPRSGRRGRPQPAPDDDVDLHDGSTFEVGPVRIRLSLGEPTT